MHIYAQKHIYVSASLHTCFFEGMYDYNKLFIRTVVAKAYVINALNLFQLDDKKFISRRMASLNSNILGNFKAIFDKGCG
jgi:hypothetical protein